MKSIQIILIALTTFSLISCSTSNKATQTTSENTTKGTSIESHNAIVVINTATWCGTCQKHGMRVEEEIVSQFISDERYTIVVNNLSTDETKAESKKKLEEAGLPTFAKENNGTGLIYFMNASNKEFISKISVSKSTEAILQEFENALIN